MKPRVYVETSIVSYLTARPARDIVVAGRQQTTRDWWANAPQRFELVISELVREEAAVGDDDAARARLVALAPLTRLAAPMEARELAHRLVNAGAVPERAAQDALHIGIAAVHGVEFARNLERPPHCERGGQAADRIGLSPGGRRSPGPVHSGRTRGGRGGPRMKADPIVAEVRAVRDRLAARFDYDRRRDFPAHPGGGSKIGPHVRALYTAQTCPC